MPPRHAYWTILIDDTPTAFRAREREELQPTFVQLQRKNPNVAMKWFARGKLWASREAERDDFQMQRNAAMAPRDRRDEHGVPAERRGADWRPGGAHKDPRDRFKKKNRPERAWSDKDPATQRDRDRPAYAAKRRDDRRPGPSGPGEKRPPAPRSSFGRKPSGGGWSGKPRGDRPWSKPAGDRPRDDRRPGPAGSGETRPSAPRSSFDRKPSGGGWSGKPRGGAPPAPSDRPWQTKPTGPRAQRKPWIPKGEGFRPGGDRPPAHRSSFDRKPSGGGWSGKPPSGPPRERRPWSGKPRAGGQPPRKRRDDDDKG